ncbi:MAG TPA: hypothetical protein VI339_06435 [Steroidobacteraceae bacterium]|nr:hypothetical protein [Steroidobacteraceae bacterium]
MSNRVLKKPVALAIGAALAMSVAAAGTAQASSFAVNALAVGYMLAGGECGGDKKEAEQPQG